MEIRRRDFLKAGVAASASIALNGLTLNAFANGKDHRIGSGGTEPGQWIPSTCEGCTTWCAVEVFVQEGRAVKVRGNQHSKSNDGFVCPRGHLSLQEVYDPDRIKVPMKRTNPQKGRTEDPKFVPITWDEAITEIATRLNALRAAGESHKVVVLRGRYTEVNDILYDRFPALIGTPNKVSHSAICAEAEKFGYLHTMEIFGYPDYDLDNTKYLMLWGVDPVSSNRLVPGAIKTLFDDRDKRVVVVDPRMSTSAAKAHRWLPVAPGTDGALALAIAHWILAKGLWNREFVGLDDAMFSAGADAKVGTVAEKGTKGLVQWWNMELKNRTPEWASGITGIPVATITATAEEFAKAGSMAISWVGPGIGMQPRGGYGAFAAAALNGLVGSADHAGGVLPRIPSHDPAIKSLRGASATGGATSATANTLTDLGYPPKRWSTDTWKGYTVMITGGTGRDQVRTITANGPNGFTVSPDWATVPDSTSRYRIEADEAAVKGNGQRRFDRYRPAAEPQGPSVPLSMPAFSKTLGGVIVTNAVADGINAKSPYDCKMVIGYWQNFAFSCQGARRWEEAFSKTYFVQIGTNPCESTMLADIVLPANHHMFESLAYMVQKARRHNILTMNRPMIKKLWDSKEPETEFVWLLAKKMAALGGTTKLKEYVESSSFNDPVSGKRASEFSAEEFHEACVKIKTVGSYPEVLKEDLTLSASRVVAGTVNAPSGSVLKAGTILKAGTLLTRKADRGAFSADASKFTSDMLKEDLGPLGSDRTLSGRVIAIAGSTLAGGSLVKKGTLVGSGSDRKEMGGAYIAAPAAWAQLMGTAYTPNWEGTGEGVGNGIRQRAFSEPGGVRRAAMDPTAGEDDRGFRTQSGKFEFFNDNMQTRTETERTHETLAKLLDRTIKQSGVPAGTTLADLFKACNYPNAAANPTLGFMPHWEPPAFAGDPASFPFVLVDYKSRLNKEGRTGNTAWYHDFKKVDPGDESWDDVVKINPADAGRLGIKTGDSVKVTSPGGSITVTAKVWEGVKPGTAVKSFGQGHWAYGRLASKDFHKGIPRGGNNNDLIPVEYERLSGSAARNAVTRVKIEKV